MGGPEKICVSWMEKGAGTRKSWEPTPPASLGGGERTLWGTRASLKTGNEAKNLPQVKTSGTPQSVIPQKRLPKHLGQGQGHKWCSVNIC